MNRASASCEEPQPYGDPTELNTARQILDSVGRDVLGDIMGDYVGLLQTSAVIYEANGDYARGIFTSGWCRKMDETSRFRCGTSDNQQALACGKWHCHESCWKISRTSIDTGEPADLPCLGGIRIYAVPVRANGKVIGSINFGYGNPPTDPEKLCEIADRYGLSVAELQNLAASYPHREPWVIEVAKQMLKTAARIIGAIVERKQSERESRRLGEELRFINDVVEQSTQPFATTTLDGRIVQCNQAFERLTGYSSVELRDLPYQRLTPERWYGIEAQHIAHTLETGESARFEKEYQRKDGSTVSIEVVSDLRKRAEGEPPVFCKFVTDITERKFASAALAESESRLRLLLNSAEESIYGLDNNENFTFCNDAFLRLLGYNRREDVLGKNVRQLIHVTRIDGTPYPVEESRIYKAHRRGVGTHVADEVFWRADGTSFPAEYWSYPVERDGRIVGSVVTFFDISERKRTEAALAIKSDELFKSQESLRLRSELMQGIIDSMGEGVVVADEAGKFLHWNPAAEAILGMGAQDVSQGKWTDVDGFFMADQVTPYPPEERPMARAIRGEFVDDVELFVRHARMPQGGWILVTGRPLFDVQGLPRGGVAVFRDVTEIKRAEKALIEREHQLREACRIGQLGYWEYEIARRAFVFTDSFYDLLHTSADKENGYQMSPEAYASRFLPSDEQHLIAKELSQAIACPEVDYDREFETRVITADGQTRHFQVRFQLVRDAGGQPLKLVGADQDVTQRVLSEQTLRKSEERFRVAIIDAPFPILLHAEDGEVIQVSQAWTEISGFGRDELRTTAAWTELAYGERKGIVKADMERSYGLEGRRHEGEYVITTRSGEQRTWDFSSAPLGPLPDGRRLVISMAMDVTERKQAEEQLRELNAELDQRVQSRTVELKISRDRFKTIFEESPIGIAVIDSLSGKILEVNSQFAKIAGRTREQIATIDWISTTHSDDVQEVRDRMAALNDGTIAGFSMQKRYRRPNGQFVWINMTIARITVEDTRRPRHLCMIEDINEQKMSQDEIVSLNHDLKIQIVKVEEANKELEAFSYSVSHDLRAPLRAIDGFSKILLKEHSAEVGAEAREYLQDLRTNTQQMGYLIDDLLAFSRLSRLPVNKESVSQGKLVHKCLDELKADREGRQVQFHVGELPLGSADPALIKQVWLNLLGNAIKYTSKREVARIEVGSDVSESKEQVYFVKDNGVGFDMRYAHKLFGVFQRLHRAEDYDGTGVGLAIVQRIIHRHGGRVWAEAEPDKGATFFFTLGTEGLDHD